MNSCVIEGALVFATMREWLPRIDELSAQERLDLSGVTRVDSCGVSYLLELSRRAAAQGSTLRLANLPLNLDSLLQFLKVGTVLDIER